ncbi:MULTISPECIES: recombinase family protein [Sulfurimonas]|uniref:recombinase family protein n=1 Tax=Sulfurimonas TaxID=202746 RepID=UPI00125F27EE|nr:recombinase family protein [Sulfurimonas hydrogeniphila]
MTIAYIRPDKNFLSAHEQLKYINSYTTTNNLVVDDEFVDYISQNKRLEDRINVTSYFQSKEEAILLIYDVWVLTTNMEDLIQMVSCLLKNKYKVHIIKHSVIISQESSAMLILGLMDQLRQKLKNDAKRMIGRPKGSRSSSKFDIYLNEIIEYIREKKSVSEMARLLNVSRSSLKDYIESRELKQIASGSLLTHTQEDAEAQVINTIVCPD